MFLVAIFLALHVGLDEAGADRLLCGLLQSKKLAGTGKGRPEPHKNSTEYTQRCVNFLSDLLAKHYGSQEGGYGCAQPIRVHQLEWVTGMDN